MIELGEQLEAWRRIGRCTEGHGTALPQRRVLQHSFKTWLQQPRAASTRLLRGFAHVPKAEESVGRQGVSSKHRLQRLTKIVVTPRL